VARLTLLGTMVAALTLALAAGSAAGDTGPSYVPGLERDVGVSTSTAPTTGLAGDLALLSSLVVNRGGSTALVAFTDTVPDGLTINSAAAGSGSCSTTGQTVSCRILIAPADSAPVNIVVTPTAAGTYLNRVSIVSSEGQRDPNPGNDSASATLTVAEAVAPPRAPACTVPALKRMPLRVARRVLRILLCRPGKAKRVHSRGVKKGLVIRTTPKPGTYAAGKGVALLVSSGPKKAKAKRHGPRPHRPSSRP